MARSERSNESLTADELESFEEALETLEDRATEFLAKRTDRTPEQIHDAIDEYSMPDPLDDRPVDED